jgi:hypothetical protein
MASTSKKGKWDRYQCFVFQGHSFFLPAFLGSLLNSCATESKRPAQGQSAERVALCALANGSGTCLDRLEGFGDTASARMACLGWILRIGLHPYESRTTSQT